MTRAARSYFRENQGVAAVEFALIAPILFILLIGSLDIGTYMNTKMRLENLSRAVAEYLLQGGEEDNAWEDVIVASGNFSNTASLETVLTLNAQQVCSCDDGSELDCDTDCGPGEYKRHFFDVELAMNYTPILPTLGIFDGLSTRGHTRLQSE